MKTSKTSTKTKLVIPFFLFAHPHSTIRFVGFSFSCSLNHPLIPSQLRFFFSTVEEVCFNTYTNFYNLYCTLYHDLHMIRSCVIRHSIVISFMPYSIPFNSNTHYSHIIICANKITKKILLMRSTCLNKLFHRSQGISSFLYERTLHSCMQIEYVCKRELNFLYLYIHISNMIT